MGREDPQVLGGWQEGDAIESPMVTRRIEAAQKKVEERNFEIRKNLLEYDEVMDEQRKRVYSYRQAILEGVNCKDLILQMIDEQVQANLQAIPRSDLRSGNLRRLGQQPAVDAAGGAVTSAMWTSPRPNDWPRKRPSGPPRRRSSMPSTRIFRRMRISGLELGSARQYGEHPLGTCICGSGN